MQSTTIDITPKDNSIDEDPFFRSKYQRSGFLSKIHFAFALDTFTVANKLGKAGKTIDSEEYIPDLGATERPVYFENKYQYYYETFKKKHPKRKPNMIYPILMTNGRLIAQTFFIRGCFLGLSITFVLLLKQLLDSLSDPTETIGNAFIWAGACFAAILIKFYFHHSWFFTAAILSVYIKSGLISMIYSKINKVSLYSINKLSLGKVINVVANDVNVFERTGSYFFSVPLALPALVGAAAILWSFFGVSCLVGVGFILLVYLMQECLARSTMKPRDMKNKVTDERVKFINEIIEAIRLLKMYTWELIFKDAVVKIRRREVNVLKQIVLAESFSRAISCSTQTIASFLIFLVYVLTGGELTVGQVFPTLFLMGFMKHHIVLFVSYGLNFAAEVQLVLQRVVQILELPEIDVSTIEKPVDPVNAVEFDNFSGYWAKEEERYSSERSSRKNKPSDSRQAPDIKPTIKEITLKIKKGSLNAVVGKIGCGKSSLLLAFTGEMPKHTGSLKFEGKIAYVEQEPIIFPGSLQDNVTFGKEYDQELFDKVAEACSLDSDIKILPNGQNTEIGEKGINLSGGQKARVALARAIYSKSDIYLLDDPLSAVDTKVAKVIYEKAIKGMLKDKTVLLVTHQTHFIKSCENIIVMDEGQVVAHGSYESMESEGFDLHQIFPSTIGNEKRVDEEEGEAEKDIQINQKDIEVEVKDKDKEGENDEDKGKLFVKESISADNVTFKTYKDYTSACFNKIMLFITFAIFTGNELANIAYSRLLGLWANDTLDGETSMIICGCLTFGIIVFYILKNIIYNYRVLDGSEKLHNRMMERIVRNPVEFFDTNPVGRILNRFSNDIGAIDRFLPPTSFDVVEALFFFSGVLITIWIINPYILIPTVILMIVLAFFIRYSFRGITQTKQYELVTRSPLYSLFSVTLSSLVIIRSFNQVEQIKKKFRKVLTINSKASFTFWASTRLFGFIVDYLSTITAIISMAIVTASKNPDSGLTGLSIVFILNLTENIQFNVRQAIQTNQLMSSTARVLAYCNTKTEADLATPNDQQYAETGWPQAGSISINNVYMKYRANMDHVIKELSLEAKAGEKIGCIGRTGAGKSSIIQMLFRMIEIDKEGREDSFIKIDEVDIQTIGLHFLRKNISIIPQTPVVFTGSVRRNLDPLGEHKDEELWQALEEVRLKEYVEQLENKLDTDMTNVSSVFSVGQKQLVCLARAILRKSKIIVLDEATANVDFETDNFIQEKIMEKFSACTIFTIAHRLSTIAHYDKVLVLDKGVKVEFDSPYKLLVKNVGDEEITNKEGYFASMVLNTGPKSSQHIFKVCYDKYLHDTRKIE